MTAPAPAPRKKRQRRWGRILLWLAVVGLCASALILLFARSALLRRARNEGVDIQALSWFELSARTANRAIPGGLGRLHAIDVRARWSPAPLSVQVEHLDYQPPKSQLKKPGAAPSRPGSGIARDPRPRTRSVPSWAREWLDAQDWDIHIKHGPSLELGPERSLSLKDIHLDRRAGKLDLKAQLVVPGQDPAPLRCRPEGELSWSSLHLSCEAPALFKDPFKLDLERKGRHIDIGLRQGERLVNLVRDGKKNTWQLQTKQFPALWWQAAARVFALPTLPFLEIQPQALLQVRLDLSAPTPAQDARSMTLHELEVSGLTLHHPRLGPSPIHLPPLSARGDLKIALRKRKSPQGALFVKLGDLEMQADWEISAQRHHLDLRVPNQPCMRWLETLPLAMRPALAGMVLQGESPGHLELEYDPRKRDAFEEEKPETKPGTVTLQFPFFENCQVITEPTLLTQAPVGLSSYKHPWPGTEEKKEPRLMGPAGKEFVSIGRMPLFSKAMTVTEDPKFWDHKGFDTQAMETALWYDLSKLRVARGASTISQQCARLLWLGTHRNLTRKVQEYILTWRLEASVSKRRILELYLNLIELGPSVHGGADAARFYFGRSITGLNLKESLFLATLAPAPSRKSQASASGKISSSWNDNLLRQIERLRIRGWITSEEAQDAVIAPLSLKKRQP